MFALNDCLNLGVTFSKPGTFFCELMILVPNLPFYLLLLLIAFQGLASLYFSPGSCLLLLLNCIA